MLYCLQEWDHFLARPATIEWIHAAELLGLGHLSLQRPCVTGPNPCPTTTWDHRGAPPTRVHLGLTLGCWNFLRSQQTGVFSGMEPEFPLWEFSTAITTSVSGLIA
jgi:hypothetical protein